MGKNKDYQIPFNVNNELMSYANGNGYGVTWLPNYEFQDVLKFEEFERGRSAAHAVFKSLKDNKRYPMFLKDLSDAIERLVGGTLSGQFTFQKRGQNYGVALVLPKKSKSRTEELSSSEQ